MSRPNLRRPILQLHLAIALACSGVLMCAGLTGAVLATAPELERALEPGLRRVAPAATRMDERELVTRVARAMAHVRDADAIQAVEFGDAGASQVFLMRSGARAFVDPYRGTILGMREGPTGLERVLGAVFQIHVRLLAGNAGQLVVDIATILLVLMIATGAILWWKQKRTGFRRGASWRRFNWDLHNVLGLYAGATLLALALSGLLLAWEWPLYWMVDARPEHDPPLPHSVVPAGRTGADSGSADPGDVDGWLAAADRALPGRPVTRLLLPMTPRSAVQVEKLGPGGVGRSVVYVDRYDPRALRIDDFATAPRAYRAHVIDRALHTGDIGGRPARVLASLASLAMVAMVVTGLIQAWWRLIPSRRRRAA